MNPARPFLMVPLLVLGTCLSVRADSVLMVYSNGRGGFNVAGNNLNRVTEAEIRIDYQGEGEGTPSVSGAGLGAQGELTAQTDTPGSLTIRLKSRKPMSGHALLATAQIRGAVTFANGWLRDEKGAVETPSVTVTNPPEEQSGAKVSPPPVRKPAAGVTAALPRPAAPIAPSVPAYGAQRSAEPGGAARGVTRSRRKSALELLRVYAGPRTPAALSRLFRRDDDMFLQDPPVLLSDGSASLTLEVRSSGDSPRFAISGGSCTGVEAGPEGLWRLRIVPAPGALSASVTVLSGDQAVEFPLAVAPPLAAFDLAGAEAAVIDYVENANYLAAAIGASFTPLAGSSLPAEPASEPNSPHSAQ